MRHGLWLILPPPPPSAVPLPRKRGRIQGVPAMTPRILPCEAGEGDHAKRGGGGAVAHAFARPFTA